MKYTCNYCGEPCDKIVLRLYKARKREVGRTDSVHYTHRANIGECCVIRVNAIDWQPRETRRPPSEEKD